jgi:hypothetical protein
MIAALVEHVVHHHKLVAVKLNASTIATVALIFLIINVTYLMMLTYNIIVENTTGI